ncbi:hypothetical protein VTK73DRAFT_1157 [Phialemonium thermophilum]|uniref:Uncharacterized protein n=1 Tax=Phialemonium thermophilum TaxID=223376 RepID=A0ABR3VTT5_9PEZI
MHKQKRISTKKAIIDPALLLRVPSSFVSNMSSSTSLTRSRSLGKPATSDTKMQKGEVQQQTEARNTSPSRLPVKGPSRQDTASAGIITATTSLNKNSASGGQRAGLGGSAATASHTRPISGLFGRSASVRQPQTSNTAGVTVSRPPITTRNRPTAAQTQSSSASGGAANIRRPTSSSGVAPSTATNTTAPMTTARGPGHARAKSSVTALSTATTLRPPSSQTSSGASTATTERGSRSGGSGGSSRMAHQRQPSAASAVSSLLPLLPSSSSSSSNPVFDPLSRPSSSTTPQPSLSPPNR